MLFVVVFAGALIISGLAGNTDPNGRPLLKSGDEYNALLAQANDILKMGIEKTEGGQPLTPDDLKKIREGVKMYDSLTLFNPVKMGPFFASGRLHLMLGENEAAARQFRQAIDDATQENNDPPDKVKLLTADSEFYLATAYENMNDFTDALPPINDAIQQFQDRGNYRYARARAYIQMKKIPEAIEDLKIAVAVDPNDKRSASLLKFVSSAAH